MCGERGSSSWNVDLVGVSGLVMGREVSLREKGLNMVDGTGG